jgi:hypothetical protein
MLALGSYDGLSGLLRELAFAVASFLLVTAALFIRRLPALIRSIRGASWPTAQGRVESVKVQTVAEQSLAEMAYSYVVEGERYAGYYARQFADEQDAWDFLRPLQGQSISVRYKPGRPEVSAIRMVEQGPLFATTQQNFIGRLLSSSLMHSFNLLDWRELGRFASGNWPVAKAKIELGTVTTKHIYYVIPIHTCEMGYSYSAGGEYYSGHFQRTFFRRIAANQFIEDEKGKDVLVRYNPASPNICVMRMKDQLTSQERIRAESQKVA